MLAALGQRLRQDHPQIGVLFLVFLDEFQLVSGGIGDPAHAEGRGEVEPQKARAADQCGELEFSLHLELFTFVDRHVELCVGDIRKVVLLSRTRRPAAGGERTPDLGENVALVTQQLHWFVHLRIDFEQQLPVLFPVDHGQKQPVFRGTLASQNARLQIGPEIFAKPVAQLAEHAGGLRGNRARPGLELAGQDSKSVIRKDQGHLLERLLQLELPVVEAAHLPALDLGRRLEGENTSAQENSPDRLPPDRFEEIKTSVLEQESGGVFPQLEVLNGGCPVGIQREATELLVDSQEVSSRRAGQIARSGCQQACAKDADGNREVQPHRRLLTRVLILHPAVWRRARRQPSGTRTFIVRPPR